MKIRLLISVGLLSLGLSVHAQESPPWGYRGENGPEHWGNLSQKFGVCASGKNQSPVNLDEAVKTDTHSLRLGYRPQSYHAENNGRTLQVVPSGGDQTIEIGDKVFALKQFHFHTPSEHTFKDKHFPMEAHFVHQTPGGEIAVLAVMFKEGGKNSALVPLIAKKLAPNESADIPEKLNVGDFFPKNGKHFRLNGSLTTPPCSEGVNWVIFQIPVSASKEQIAAMQAILGQNNNRPLQPINSRIVIEETK